MHELIVFERDTINGFVRDFSPLQYARMFDYTSSLPVIYEDPLRFFYDTPYSFLGELAYQPVGYLTFLLLRKKYPTTDIYPEDLVQRMAKIALTDSICVPLNHLLPHAYWEYVAPTGHTVDNPLITLESFLYDYFETFDEATVYQTYTESIDLLSTTWDTMRLNRLELVFYSFEDHERQDEGLNEQYSIYLDKIEDETADQKEKDNDVFYIRHTVKIRGGGFSCYLQ